MSSFTREVEKGQRFEFGKNWTAFLSTLNDDRIMIAVNSLKEMLECDHPREKNSWILVQEAGSFLWQPENWGQPCTLSITIYSP